MPLQEEIEKARNEIRTDGYGISIGEWISLYEKHELDIHPEFQRFFRWSPKQKSRFIESILLGIPVPPIFVAQRKDGVWDVVDGLQRLSTIFQFAGILRYESGEKVDPLILEPTFYLPSLGGKAWERPDDAESLTTAQRLLIKRSKIDVSIILSESDSKTKYELFQRLNTGGSPLSDQEVRNSILIMIKPEFFAWLNGLAKEAAFQECVALSDRGLSEQYDLELLLRFIVFRTLSDAQLSSIGDLGDFLTDKGIEFAQNENFDLHEHTKAVRETFQLLQQRLGSDAFRRYDGAKGRFLGGFSVSAFEAVSLGIAHNLEFVRGQPESINRNVQELWQRNEFVANSGSGIRASSRIPKTVPFARELFSK